MRMSFRAQLYTAVFAALLAASGAALARCTINAAGLTITPLTGSTGTYTYPTAPTAQARTLTVSGTYNTNGSAGTCTVAISFNRASLPATMAISGGGGSTLPYTITSAAGGGNTLLYTGAGVPAAANRLAVSFASAGPNLTNRAFTTTLTAYALAQPGSPQAAGSYSDSLVLHVFNVRTGGTATNLINPGFTLSGTVAKVCTIGGVATPAADSATIPITTAGAVNTAAINRSYASAACNTPSNLQLTSQSGAVKNTGAAPTGFTNLINYSASATFSGAGATLNTATIATATGAEAGTAVSTSGVTPSGTLSVTITPQANAKPLITGTYTDTLRITITPQ